MQPTSEQLARWGEIRKRGRLRFVVLNGVLGWGLTTGVLYSVVMALLMGRSLLTLLTYSLVLFPIGGIFFGLWTWHSSEKNWRRFSQQSESTAGPGDP